MTTNLIIATYSGRYYKFDSIYNKFNDREHYLKYTLALLNKIKTNINQITIMKPKVNEEHSEIKDYYNFDNIDLDNIKDKIKIIDCENIGISYGQFFNGIKDNLEFDYHIFIEDDYIPFKDYFEEDLIKETIERSNNGFICSFIHKDLEFNMINSMKVETIDIQDQVILKLNKYNIENKKYKVPDFSLGILSKYSVNKILEKFIDFNNVIDFFNIKFKGIYLHQVLFGYVLHISNVPIYDIADKYLNIFYSSHDNKIYICNFNSFHNIVHWMKQTDYYKKFKCPLFIPVDIFTLDSYNNYITEMQLYLNDNTEFIEKIKIFNKEKLELMNKFTNQL
jgi:hypothetical protein